MNTHAPLTVRTLAFLLAIAAAVLCSPSDANAIPNQGNSGGLKIPADPDRAAMKRGRDTAMDYVDDYGDLSISVIAVETARGRNGDLIEAINAEITQQFRKYTANEIDIIRPEFGVERVERILARQNDDQSIEGGQRGPQQKVQDPILREMVQMSSAPYLLAFFVGPDRSGVKDAGIVTIRFIEVATGREIFQISDQFWQDKRRTGVPLGIWVQHSVTYWMNEIFDEDEINFPGAFRRFRAPIEFVGDVPDNAWLRDTISEATGINKNKLNPRRMRANGLDKVSLTLRLDAPPHIIMDEMMANLQEAFAKKDLDARPLSQDGGSIIFAVSAVPMWYAISDKKDNLIKDEFKKAYQGIGSPNIAVLTYASNRVNWAHWGGGNSAAIGTASEGILAELNASIVGVGTIDQNFADIRSAAVNGRFGKAVRDAMPDNLRERTDWVLMIEVVPAYRDRQGYKSTATARLIDLQQDRVVGAAIFPADNSVVPAGEARLEPLTHAARYLTGSVARTLMMRLKSGAPEKVLDVIIDNAPNFEFVNRVENIIRSRDQITDTKLPSFTKAGARYAFEAKYTGDGRDMLERLRADLSTLPLEIKQLDSGQITVGYTGEDAP
ncbi:MAG: hypothetical protein ACPGYV_09580 [Phycisphaeraceae bacterium]